MAVETETTGMYCKCCGKELAYTRLADSVNGIPVHWWLDIPCECGSQFFIAKVSKDNLAKWVGSYGTNA